MDMQLILCARQPRIHGERDVVIRKRPLAQFAQKVAGVPSVLEVVRRLCGPKPWILDADNLLGGRQDNVSKAGATKDDVPTIFPIFSPSGLWGRNFG